MRVSVLGFRLHNAALRDVGDWNRTFKVVRFIVYKGEGSRMKAWGFSNLQVS